MKQKIFNGTTPIARPLPRKQFLPMNSGNATNSGFAPSGAMKGATGIKGLLRDSLAKNRKESFKELM